ncbi:MAG: hypothetical protein KF746_14040 [Chitinophagaceae bacterium]|nr:hypothetical protein [Chitinophagaceae bacterium]
MKQYITYLALAGIIAGFAACKKESGPTRKEILISHSWRQTNVTSLQSNGAIHENWLYMKACDKDDQFIFAPDSVLLQLEGPTRCNPGDPDVKSGSAGRWHLSADEQTLLIGSIENKIQKLTTDSLVIDRTLSGGSIATYRLSHY